MGSRFYGWSMKVYGALVDDCDVDWMELGKLVRERKGAFEERWLEGYDLHDADSLREFAESFEDEGYPGALVLLALLVDNGAGGRFGCYGGDDCVSISGSGVGEGGGYVIGVPAVPMFPWTVAETGGRLTRESAEAAIRAVLDRVMPERAAVAEYDLEFVSFG